MLEKYRLICELPKFPIKINNIKEVKMARDNQHQITSFLARSPLFTQVIKGTVGSQLLKPVKVYGPESERN